jgi:electron transfer flavoprotein beta subunit
MSGLKIVCCVKQTFATDTTIELTEDSRINDATAARVVNPYDEFAVEEALRIRETHGGEVTVVAVGPARAEEALRHCLAMGADNAIRISDDGLSGRDSSATANLLAAQIGKLEFDLILCGKVAVDSNAGETAVRLAELLGLPQIHTVSELKIEDGAAVGRRESDGAAEIIEAPLPTLVTAEKGLNEPRYPTLPNIMKAKRKPIEVVLWNDLGFSDADDKRLAPMVDVIGYSLPPARQGVKMIEGDAASAAKELVRALHEDEGIL